MASGISYLSESTHRVQIIPLSHGNDFNLIERAAELGGRLITEHRTGRMINYTDQAAEVLSHGVSVPRGMTHVAWARDSDSLWNEVTDGLGTPVDDSQNDPVKSLTTSGRQFAREYRMEVPRGLGLKRGIDLLQQFARVVSDRDQTPVQFNLRLSADSQSDFLGYLLSPVRELTESGFGRTVIRDNPSFSARSATVDWYQTTWTNLTNEALRNAKEREQGKLGEAREKNRLPDSNRGLMDRAVHNFRQLRSRFKNDAAQPKQIGPALTGRDDGHGL